MLGTVKARWVFTTVVFFSVVVSRSKPRVDSEREKPFLSSSSSPAKSSSASEEPVVTLVSMASSDGGQEEFYTETTTGEGWRNLEYDFYRNSCPQAETIVRSKMAWIYGQHRNVSAQLLRLFFHDCFIEGCDASVLLDDSNGDKNHSIEKQATPNRSLKGFDKIDQIKEALENVCPGVVSCADVLALAARDGIILAGGPYYPVLTGRRDSTQSYFDVALEEIPKPDDNITHILHLFSSRGFSERETVALLGAHNIGKIGCEFIQSRVDNFTGTGQPDPALPFDLLTTMKLKCQDNANRATSNTDASQSSLSISSGAVFDSHYYQNLLRGRGILFADQQLMANRMTAQVVAAFASDNGSAFRMEFAQAMRKMSTLGVLTGSQGQVRSVCSLPVNSY
ncbi:putative Peroxidase 48 [Rosa sericea]